MNDLQSASQPHAHAADALGAWAAQTPGLTEAIIWTLQHPWLSCLSVLLTAALLAAALELLTERPREATQEA